MNTHNDNIDFVRIIIDQNNTNDREITIVNKEVINKIKNRLKSKNLNIYIYFNTASNTTFEIF